MMDCSIPAVSVMALNNKLVLIKSSIYSISNLSFTLCHVDVNGGQRYLSNSKEYVDKSLGPYLCYIGQLGNV